MTSPSKETFKGYTVNSKLDTLYDFHIETFDMMERFGNRVETVEKCQKKWKLVSGTVAMGSGLFGGFLAMLAKLVFWK